MSSRNHGINANVEILVIPVNLSIGNGDIPTLILWQQSIKIGLIPNGISFQMFKVLHVYAPRGCAFFVPLGGIIAKKAAAELPRTLFVAIILLRQGYGG